MRKVLIRRLSLLFVLVFSGWTSYAQEVSLSVARERALRFFSTFSTTDSDIHRAPRKAPQLTQTGNRTEFFIFNDEANGGYVIISGDERMPEVLGYSFKGRIDSDCLPCNLQAWLEGYACQVERLRRGTAVAAPSRMKAQQKAVAPLLSTTWNQQTPYNDQCPFSGSTRCLAGCVAVAKAQVMRYHEWPPQTYETIPAYTTATNRFYVSSIKPTTIQWGRMLDDYSSVSYTKEEGEAVAALMKLVGTAVQMDYDLYSSNAMFRPDVLAQYFGYDAETMRSVPREYYDDESWEQLIYGELEAKRPVLYSGDNQESSGHAFVIDGCDTKGFFHVNWGWGGAQDGYFLLSSLGQYNENQWAVVGIQPGDPYAAKPYGILNDGRVTLYYDYLQQHRHGTLVMPVSSLAQRTDITECVIDSSFWDYRISSLASYFDGCSNLQTIVGMENFNTTSVKNFDRMFAGCASLQRINFTDFGTAKATSMKQMFEGCASLSVLDLNGFSTSRVTNMARMFAGCSSLVAIYVGDGWSTAKVTSGTEMFAGCNKLQGGAHTAYSAAHDGVDYACIDGGTESPGYLTYGTAPDDVENIQDPQFHFSFEGKPVGGTVIYDLQGRRICYPERRTGALFKGIYILNGRKVMTR